MSPTRYEEVARVGRVTNLRGCYEEVTTKPLPWNIALSPRKSIEQSNFIQNKSSICNRQRNTNIQRHHLRSYLEENCMLQFGDFHFTNLVTSMHVKLCFVASDRLIFLLLYFELGLTLQTFPRRLMSRAFILQWCSGGGVR